MDNKKFVSFIVLILAICSANLTVKSQEPETVKVVSFTASHTGIQSNTDFTMTVRDAKGFTTYAGRGGYSLPVFSCAPCSAPNTFSSDGFSIGFSGFNWAFDKYVRFYVTAVESDPIVLSSIDPFSRWRRNISVNGITKIKGRVEIRDGSNQIIAVDNNIILAGKYAADFIRLPYNPNLIQFTQMSYGLSQSAE